MTGKDIELPPEIIRDYIAKQTCWMCGKGDWKALCQHVSKKHGIPAAQIREIAYMFKTERLISDELSQRLSKNALVKFGSRRHIGGSRKVKHILSTKGKDRSRTLVNSIRHLRKDYKRQPHNCAICGTLIPTSNPRYCSRKCSRIAFSNAVKKAMTPERIEHFKSVRYHASREELSVRLKEYWRRFRLLPVDEQREFLLRRADKLRVAPLPQNCVICGAIYYLTPYQANKSPRIRTCRQPSCKTELKSRLGTGRRHTEETRRKMSEYARRRHEREGGRFGYSDN